MSRIKIFVTWSQCLSKEKFVDNKIFTPVLGGAAGKVNAGQIQGDDEGENISLQNEIYCELSTQYWAWKNVELDYYGFCHYRRFFSFNPVYLEHDDWRVVNFAYANSQTKSKLCLDDIKRIEDTVRDYDILVPEAVNLKKVGYDSIYEQFIKTPFMKAEALDLTIEIIRDFYPEYYEAAKKYMYGHQFYPYNMFIMTKKLFMEYSSWLFSILEKVIARIDMEDYSIQSIRIPAHIGERLFGVYLTYLKDNQEKIKIKELQVGFIHNTSLDKMSQIAPAFRSSNIPIVMSANEFFSPVLAAALYSIKESSKKDTNYDIVILERDILEKTKLRLKSIFKDYNNISLRFYNVGALIDNYHLYISNLITVETYYRFLIPELFSGLSKVLYLDGDIIVKRDVADLFKIDIGKQLVGACHDITCMGLVNGFDEEAYQYCINKMKLKNPLNQFNAGVMIMNLDEFRKSFTTDYMLKFAENGKFKFWDQDALNILCEDKVHWLDYAWNYMADEKSGWRGNINRFAPKKSYELYLEAGKNPFIYHFAGNEKPWFDPNYQYAEEFWSVLRNTPFYEIMLQRRMIDTSCYFIDQRRQEAGPESLRHLAKRILAALFPPATLRGRIVRKAYRGIKKGKGKNEN